MLKIEPQSIRQGVQVTVSIEGEALVKEIFVVPHASLNLAPFPVPTKRLANTDIAQLVFGLAGKYRIVAGESYQWITVHPQRDLNFGTEFGLTAILVIIAFFGVISWVRRKAG